MGWPASRIVLDMFALADAEWEQRFAAGALSGTVDVEQANAGHLHDVWREVAPLLGLMYSRERLPL